MKEIGIQHSSENVFCLRGQKDDENVDNNGNGLEGCNSVDVVRRKELV